MLGLRIIHVIHRKGDPRSALDDMSGLELMGKAVKVSRSYSVSFYSQLCINIKPNKNSGGVVLKFKYQRILMNKIL